MQRRAICAVIVAGLAATPLLRAAADETPPMAFTVERSAGGKIVFGRGTILPATPAAFEALLAKETIPAGTIFFLSSPGGDIDAGLALGRAIRSHGLNTSIGKSGGDKTAAKPGLCGSACALAFLGGVSRAVPPGSRYVVHQVRIACTVDDAPADAEHCISSGAAAFADGMAMGARLAIYIQEMGADLGLLNELAKAAPDEANDLDRAQLVRYGVITPAQ